MMTIMWLYNCLCAQPAPSGTHLGEGGWWDAKMTPAVIREAQ